MTQSGGELRVWGNKGGTRSGKRLATRAAAARSTSSGGHGERDWEDSPQGEGKPRPPTGTGNSHGNKGGDNIPRAIMQNDAIDIQSNISLGEGGYDQQGQGEREDPAQGPRGKTQGGVSQGR